MSYVVYGHYGDDGVCFYVGMGSKNRPYKSSNRSTFWKNYVKKHCVSGKPEVKIWHQNLTWEQAQEHEKFWISIYGRRDNGTGVLVNLTDGGDGTVGCIPSEETRQKQSLKRIGRKHTEEARMKMSISGKGKIINPEQRLKISTTKKGKPSSNKGRTLSEEHKAKVSAALKGRLAWNKGVPYSEETKAKISEALKGKTHSEETRQKMREAHTRRKKNGF